MDQLRHLAVIGELETRNNELNELNDNLKKSYSEVVDTLKNIRRQNKNLEKTNKKLTKKSVEQTSVWKAIAAALSPIGPVAPRWRLRMIGSILKTSPAFDPDSQDRYDAEA